MRSLMIFPIWLLFVCFMGYGWVVNVWDLAHMYGGITGMMALRIVGIFIFPLGAILGYWS